MTKRPARKSAGKSVSSEPSPIPGFLVACVLIGLFTYRLTVPAHESPLLPELVLTIAFDAVMVVGLIAMRARIAAPLFWAALVAGVGLFVIRLTSDSSWWTGHLLWTME
jgi:hypothetical protein